VNVRDLARALGGEVSGLQVLAPGPGHSHGDRSLAVRLSRSAPDGLLVFSHCGDDWRLCRKHVGERLGLARRRPDARLPIHTASPDRANETEVAARTRRALAIWYETADPHGTPVWRHLAARGIALSKLPSRIHAALRWHPHCPWGAGGARHGCMVALWTDAVSGEPRAIHRTAITNAGAKVGRKTLGPNAGCVIRLWPDGEVERGLKAHPPDGEGKIWWSRLKKALGTSSSAFVEASLFQLQAAARLPGGGISELGVNSALALIEGAAPKDEIEGALAVQMACTHTAAMALLARLQDGYPTERRTSLFASAATRLLRVYVSQVEALRRLRHGGSQFVRVEHVHVSEGGQAVIGNVRSPTSPSCRNPE
jgi:hypothetical protein